MTTGALSSGALFSEDRVYRYRLWRVQYPHPGLVPPNDNRTVLFVMLNPSTADETVNDPTVERCWRRTVQWGYRRMEVCNIFALRSTDPMALYDHADPVGMSNDYYLQRVASTADLIICGWGAHGSLRGRGHHVLNLLKPWNPHALKITKGGFPQHPLYISYKQQPIPLNGKGLA